MTRYPKKKKTVVSIPIKPTQKYLVLSGPHRPESVG
jgi:hypothetical protein